MKILDKIIEEFNTHICDEPPETGGILGSSAGDVIDCIVFDSTSDSDCACSYSPDTDFLNSCIAEWLSRGIEFKGVFHTHFASVKTLSECDKTYITEIMNAMPEEIGSLYFPLYVLPDRRLVCHRADRTDCGTVFCTEETEVICYFAPEESEG